MSLPRYRVSLYSLHQERRLVSAAAVEGKFCIPNPHLGHNAQSRLLPNHLMTQSRAASPPQGTYFAPGTVRFNADPPRQLRRRADPIHPLRTQHLGRNITAHTDGIPSNMEPELLSHGQRQLFCLAPHYSAPLAELWFSMRRLRRQVSRCSGSSEHGSVTKR